MASLKIMCDRIKQLDENAIEYFFDLCHYLMSLPAEVLADLIFGELHYLVDLLHWSVNTNSYSVQKAILEILAKFSTGALDWMFHLMLSQYDVIADDTFALVRNVVKQNLK
ncbi:hypothetical protein TrispH2_005803 [Trichoplax sp. H2]|nr:hypothetical protein TrispH2_005803 [Trichoplax sp. H2]|eukprot:RDD41909.1 hypothetical protein TrispH2_005803 [Trichoplax sp. H2]